MSSFRRLGARLGAALLALSASVFSADFALSGTVYGTDNKPLSGVVVQLAQAGLSTTTDASGAWSLGSTTGIGKRQVVAVGSSGRLVVEDAHLSVRLGGHDLLGRGQGFSASVMKPKGLAARSAASQDTLQYSWLGKVRLRDTASVSQAGIVRTLDTTFNASIIYGYLTDERDGQTYRTVRIGSQTWMAQSLNFRVDSSWVYKCQTWDKGCLTDSLAMGAKYGRLYAWTAAMSLNDSCKMKSCTSQVTAKRQGECPMGWHVPSDAEWTKLTDTTLAEATAGAKLKANSNLWSTNTGTDDYGFSVLPAGIRDYYIGSFDGLGISAGFWSASESDGSSAWDRFFHSGFADVTRHSNLKSNGYSLRCLLD